MAAATRLGLGGYPVAALPSGTPTASLSGNSLSTLYAKITPTLAVSVSGVAFNRLTGKLGTGFVIAFAGRCFASLFGKVGSTYLLSLQAKSKSTLFIKIAYQLLVQLSATLKATLKDKAGLTESLTLAAKGLLASFSKSASTLSVAILGRSKAQATTRGVFGFFQQLRGSLFAAHKLVAGSSVATALRGRGSLESFGKLTSLLSVVIRGTSSAKSFTSGVFGFFKQLQARLFISSRALSQTAFTSPLKANASFKAFSKASASATLSLFGHALFAFFGLGGLTTGAQTLHLFGSVFLLGAGRGFATKLIALSSISTATATASGLLGGGTILLFGRSLLALFDIFKFRVHPPLDVTPRYTSGPAKNTLYLVGLKAADSYVGQFEASPLYFTEPESLSGYTTQWAYSTSYTADSSYIATTRATNMPQAKPLPPIDAVVQYQTITLDFGDGPYLPEGVTLTGTPTVKLVVQRGADPDPTSRIQVAPVIGTAPAPNGSGRLNCAVLVQVGNCPGPLAYIVECVCGRTDGDIASMDALLPVRVPGGT